MKYKVGDRVHIVSERTAGMEPYGGMDHWLGKVMTIQCVIASDYYRMVEDRAENGDAGWYWRDSMIAGPAEEETSAHKIEMLIKYLEDTKKMERIGLDHVDADADIIYLTDAAFEAASEGRGYEIEPYLPSYDRKYFCIGRVKFCTAIQKTPISGRPD